MARRAALHRAMRRVLLVNQGTAMMPGEGPQELAQLERRLGAPLPDEVWDLWRVYGGQQAHCRSGIFQGARMLTTAEVLDQGLTRTVAIAGLGGRPELLHAPDVAEPAGSEKKSDAALCSSELAETASPVIPLVPLSDKLRGGRHYAVAPDGGIWLVSSFNILPAGESLCGVLLRMLPG